MDKPLPKASNGGLWSVHLFTPRILNRANIRRNEESGYPNRLKKNVTKTIVPKKKINCFVDLDISTANSLFPAARPFKKS